MTDRRAALQLKSDATKGGIKYDPQSLRMLTQKSDSSKTIHDFSTGWRRMWLLIQERVVGFLMPKDGYVHVC